MASMDEFREERAALKNADLKTKWEYFLDYYKWHAIAGLAIIIAIISFVHSVATRKDIALSGYFLNPISGYTNDYSQAEELTASFAEAAGIDLNEYDIQLDSTLQFYKDSMDEMSVAALQRIQVTVAAQDTEFIVADYDTFETFLLSEYFYDLRELYPEEELAKYEGYLYYVDMDVIRDQQAVLETGNPNYTVVEYDHLVPETMGDPVPVAFCIQDSPVIGELYPYTSKPIPMGIVVSTKRLDTALAFADYLLESIVVE